MQSRTTYLIDMQARVVHTWESDRRPALGAWLLENGHLLRTGALPEQAGFNSAGSGGRVQELSWDGELLWDFQFANAKQCPHHDLIRLPNGNVLMIVAEEWTPQEALAAGRRARQATRPALLDGLVEVKPTGKTTGEVVWEWHLRDHLVQDHDASKANYGNVAEHPDLVDVNFSAEPPDSMMRTKRGLDKLRSIGYLGSGAPSNPNALWTHFNSVAYHPEFDQILVSVRGFSEIWVLDHSTTTAEAAGHTGGRSSRGGDLLYRWGNPRAYRAGTRAEQRLFSQHDAQWIPPGFPGTGHVLVFNNGSSARPGVVHSSVDELVPAVDPDGRYPRVAEAAYGPDQPLWSYSAPNTQDFFSAQISGVQRLPNGDTLICSGMDGALFEVTPEKEVVWKCVVPTHQASLFRAQRYGRGYAGLIDEDLRPGKTLAELLEAGDGRPAR
jgi:hypothetical protein